MSLIYKNHLVFPTFKHSETITTHKPSSLRPIQRFQSVTPIRQGNACKIRPLNITALPGNETTINGESTITPRQKQLPILTPRIQRSDEQNLHDYLDHLNSIRKQKQPTKQAVMKKIRTETEIMKLESQTLIQRFKKVKEQQEQKKKYSLLQTIKNPQAQQYINFSKQIFNLIHNLHQLKEYLNNSRKMFQVVKNLIGMKKNLKKILLKQSADELIDFQDIAKMCCIREIQYINGEQRMIDKFDLTLMDDLTYMSEAIENLLLQNNLNAIKRMSDNIQIEELEISKLREQLGMREEDQKLSVSTLAMQRFKPHLELDSIEQRLGQLSQIPKQFRQTSQVLCEIVDKLNE
ncbi:unnamed protein product [Paramecium sonneborni]|uniref:Uncharacterized protein n=1 Tax=Paramecium sonneborni TaxID=65129 RepID=A0A8S1LWG4_9CILI|nr:unnamed protein product [Paramecium sonneborni]